MRLNIMDLLDQEQLLHHLRRVKKRLARQNMLTEHNMLFDGIEQKTRTDDYVDVIVRIKKVEYEKGSPLIYVEDRSGSDGSLIPNMAAYLDVFFIDETSRPISMERIMKAVQAVRLEPEMLDQENIRRNIAEVHETRLPRKHIPIASGLAPEIGRNAEIEFFFPAVAEVGNAGNYYSSRRVKKGDLLCRKIPPEKGGKPGRNVLGDLIPPRAGLDVELKSRAGTVASFDDTEVSADVDGVVVAERTMMRVKTGPMTREIPQSIAVKVNSVLQIDGNKIIDITTNKTVEVVGNLPSGSRISTSSEVYVAGDVESGAVIEASDGVTVDGGVNGANIVSDTGVVVRRDVTGSSVKARGDLIIGGAVRKSTLVGDHIHADSVAGTHIVAQNGVTVNRVGMDENGILSKICVGMSDFYDQRMHENQGFIEKAKANLARIEMLLGPDIMAQIGLDNTQAVLMKFLARSRKQDSEVRHQIDVYRKLIETVEPTRIMMSQKLAENRRMNRQMREAAASDLNVIIVREKIESRTIVSLDGTEQTIQPLDGPVELNKDTSGQIGIKPAGAE